MIHELKTWPEFFQPVIDERKRFELRRDDRPFDVDDVLHLREWNPDIRQYTGRECRARVTYVTRAWMPLNMFALGIELLSATGH